MRPVADVDSAVRARFFRLFCLELDEIGEGSLLLEWLLPVGVCRLLRELWTPLFLLLVS